MASFPREEDGSDPGPLELMEAALAEERLVIQRCAACTRHAFPPRRRCPHCKQDALSFVEPSGQGTVYAATIISRRQGRGGDYNVVIVELEEGVRLMGRVEDAEPDEVRIGLPVRTSFRPGPDGALLVFLAKEGA